MHISISVIYEDFNPKTYQGILITIKGDDIHDEKVVNEHEQTSLAPQVLYNRWVKDWLTTIQYIEETFDKSRDQVIIEDSWNDFEADSQIPSPRYIQKVWDKISV